MIKLRDYEKEHLKTMRDGMRKLKMDFCIGDYTISHRDSELIKAIIREKLEEDNG